VTRPRTLRARTVPAVRSVRPARVGDAHDASIHPFGGGVIGNTTGSGPVIEGSSPSPRAGRAAHARRSTREPTSVGSARLACRRHAARPRVPSSSGLGRRPLKAVTAVQIRRGYVVAATMRSRTPVRDVGGGLGLRDADVAADRARTGAASRPRTRPCRRPAGPSGGSGPQLEVLEPVVGADAVAVVHDSSVRSGAPGGEP
jgi:hypothetical protein